MSNFELIRFSSADDLARAAAEAWLSEIEMAGKSGQKHTVALSGGRITQKLFQLFVELARTRATKRDHIHFFWADERCVPPDDPESNFRLADELLFRPLKIAPEQIHRVRGEDAPESAAQAAEEEIRGVVSGGIGQQPVLDLVLLGLGEDGHVASLFPGEPEELSSSPAVYRSIVNSPKHPPRRVTLGFPAIAAAKQVWMIASGNGKKQALDSSLAGGATPFARVLGLRAGTKIFTDIE